MEFVKCMKEMITAFHVIDKADSGKYLSLVSAQIAYYLLFSLALHK